MPRKVIAGLDTHWVSYGQGPRPALLTHCSLGHSKPYGKLGAELGGALSITAFDMPGHGKSADWDGVSDLHTQVRDVASELLTEPMDLIGHSFGASVALRLAIEQPDKVRSLTMIEAPMTAVVMDEPGGYAERVRAVLDEFETAFAEGRLEDAARCFLANFGGGRPWEEMSEEAREAVAARIHLVVAGTPAVEYDTHNLLDPDKLARVTMPSLIIDSGGSGDVMSAVQLGLARRLPNATHVRVTQQGAGHMLPITHPRPVAAEILNLISRAPA